ncbi:hypothetical protein LZ009_16445 [Ramlibacter sp. XY19]|uniref:hypothetical protein n=1 Tax=Ramlibacter paludis TaxID=2908000 RepID=UPI0023DB43D7|nr:hypothetical protein [Ramlibacter paludis]MCG2594369.1 hypothetical protein [Ramlibacter paludis]
MALRSLASLLPTLLLATACAAQPAAAVQREGDAIVFDGRIDLASAARFLQLLGAPGVTRIVITSPGGLVAPALDMAQAIHARGLAVEVPATCLSSCANYVFPAGRRKLLGRPDAVGWHGNMAHVLWLQQSGQASWSDAELAQARLLARREADFYRAIGVDGYVAWFGKLPPHAVDEFYYLAPEDLVRFGIGDVTVRAGAASGDPALRLLAVDWPVLQAQRPAVRLDD